MKPQLLLRLACFLIVLPACQSAPDGQPNPAQIRSLNSPWTAHTKEPGWQWDIALALESEPDYAGSDDNETEADAFLRALYRSQEGHRAFFTPGDLGAWWSLTPNVVLGTVLEYELGRENTNPALQGFEPVDDTLEGQITLAQRTGDWTLAAVLQPDLLDRGKGFVSFVALGFDRMLTDRLRLGATVDLSTGDAEHMFTEFGVSNQSSAASGLAPYDPRAGLKSSTLGIELEALLGTGWSVFGGVELEYYYSKAADSPLLRGEGSELTYEASLGLRYSF